MAQKEFDSIIRLLKNSKKPFDLLEHAPVFTSQQAADLRKVGLNQGVKAIVTRASGGRYFLFCLPADSKVDLEKAADLVNVDNLFLASKEEVLRVTGCEVGSVSPFSGVLSNIPAFFEESILKNERVDFSAGLHTRSVEMKSSDLVSLVNPRLAVFAQEKG